MQFRKQIQLFIFILFCLKAQAIFSQKNLEKVQLYAMLSKPQSDSVLIDIYNELCWPIYAGENLDSSKKYGINAIALATKTKDLKRECIAHRRLGIAYVNSSLYKEAIVEQNKSLKIAKTINYKHGEQLALNNIGVAYLDNEIYNKALSYFLQAIKIAETEKDFSNASNLYSNCGIIYMEIKNYNYAKQSFKKSIDYSKIQFDSVNIALSYIKLSSIYRELKMQDSANYFSNQAFQYTKGSVDKQLLTSFYINKGLIYFQKKEFDSTIYFFQKGILTTKKANDLVVINTNIGLSYQKISNTDSSFKYFQLAYKLSIDNRFINSILPLTQEIAMFYYQKKDISNYHFYISSYLKYMDTVLIENNAEQLVKQQLEFDFEKQEIENKIIIDQKNSEIRISNILLGVKEKQKYYFLFGLGLLGFIGFLLFIQSRNRKKTNEKLQILNNELDYANKLKAKFFSIINHDLRSPVANIIHFLHLQKENPQLLDEESKKRLENKIIDSAENLLISMEDMLLWSKGQMEHFRPQPKVIIIEDLFEELNKQFSSYQNVTFIFENSQQINLTTDINYLKTIIRNLTTNSIKALEANTNATIVWRATQENNRICLSITDNGTGAKNEQFRALYNEDEFVGIKTGLGLHLIRDLAKAIDCEIIVDIKPKLGTGILLFFNTN